VEMEEMELVESAFSDIAAFEGLKTVQEWRGHQKASLLAPAENKEQTMLCHSKLEIKDALTKVPSSETRAAVSNFRSVLGWMGDRPLPECQRMGYTEDIISVARSSQSLADEVYIQVFSGGVWYEQAKEASMDVQVLKQLRDNPSPRSELLGWKLLLRLCQQVRPSDSLEEFVRSFAMHQVNSSNHEVAQVAKHCVSDLNANVAPDKPRPDGDVDMIPVTVLLIDYSVRKVMIPRSSTLRQLKEKVGEQLRIGALEDFSFYQMIEGLDHHRMLPDSVLLSVIETKFAKLKEQNGQASHLLFKRRFLRVDEKLNPGDLIHATLTYRQVLWDFLHYPVQEDETFISSIAASIVNLEYDHYKPYVEAGRLDDPAILHQLVPQVSLRDRQFRNWSTKILQLLKSLREGIDPEEPRLMGMSR
ncbi:myoI, partial [Symbiodinium sp. CCMP2456]